MNALQLTGIIPPLVTPLDATGEVDRSAMARLIDHVITGGVNGLFVLGTTGEGPSLAQQQRRDVIAMACDLTAGRVPVLVGISDTSLEDALSLANHAEICGASAVVAAPPYYFPMTQSDLGRYFVDLAERSALPLVLYNMPACVRTKIEPDTLEFCTRSARILGVKDSSGDMAAFRRMLEVRKLRPDWKFLVGPELLLVEATLAGGDGGVSGGANLEPALFVATYEAAKRRDLEEAARLSRQIEELGRIYKVGHDFMAVARGIKGALEIVGLCSREMAPPFRGCDEGEMQAIAELLASRSRQEIRS